MQVKIRSNYIISCEFNMVSEQLPPRKIVARAIVLEPLHAAGKTYKEFLSLEVSSLKNYLNERGVAISGY